MLGIAMLAWNCQPQPQQPNILGHVNSPITTCWSSEAMVDCLNPRQVLSLDAFGAICEFFFQFQVQIQVLSCFCVGPGDEEEPILFEIYSQKDIIMLSGAFTRYHPCHFRSHLQPTQQHNEECQESVWNCLPPACHPLPTSKSFKSHVSTTS